ncbi:MAG: hypothetical protein D6767_01400, partial [Candidatus Hydrogenedentota bacterium]
MKIFRVFILPLFFSVLFAGIVFDFIQYTQNEPYAILTSSHGLLVLPIWPDLPESVRYFSYLYNPSESSFSWEIALNSISPHLAAILILFFSAWILMNMARIRRLEKAYIIFSFNLCLYYLLFLDFLLNDRMGNVFYPVALLSNVTFLYMFRAIYGKRIAKSLLVLLFIAAFGLGLLLNPKTLVEEQFAFKILGYSHFTTFVYSLLSALFYFRKKEISSERVAFANRPWVRDFLGFAAVLALGVPGLSYLFGPFLHIHLSDNVLYFIPAIFVLIFFILT